MHWVAFAAVLCLVRGETDDIAQPADALTVTADDFDLALAMSRNRPMLVMFHVAWCGVCKNTLPRFRAAAALMKKLQVNGILAHVDCTHDKRLVNQFGIEGYPTIKAFAYSREFEYEDPRTADGFITYMQRLIRPAVNVITNWTAEFEKGHNGGIFLQTAETDNFRSVAEKMRTKHLFATQHMPPGVSISDEIAVVAIPPYVLAPAQRTLSSSQLSIEWAQENRFPGVWVATNKVLYALTHAELPAVFVAVDQNSTAFEPTKQQMLRLEASGHLKCILAVIDATEWSGFLSNYGVSANNLPHVFISHSNLTYWIEDEDDLTMDHLLAAKDIESLMSQFTHQSRSVPMFFYLKWRWFRNLVRVFFPPVQAQYLSVAFSLSLVAAILFYSVIFTIKLNRAMNKDASKYD